MLDRQELDKLTSQQAEFEVFKSVFDVTIENENLTWDARDSAEYGWLEEVGKEDIALRAIRRGVLLKNINRGIYKISDEATAIMSFYYPDLLKKMQRLALELGLNNSLELSNLYSYLLWNGYLSITKQNVYNIEKRKLILGLFFTDIIDGSGVCLNHADMLKDFLNYCDYNAASLINLVDKKTKNDYKMPIERRIDDATFKTKFKNFVLSPIIKKFGNHAFTLIKDNNKFYIYDATNLSILAIEEPFSATVINGKGSCRLNLYASFGLTNSKTVEFDTISELFRMDDYSSPYTRNDFIITAEENIDLFNKSTSLFDDFYIEAKSNMDGIVTITDRLAKKKKRNN